MCTYYLELILIHRVFTYNPTLEELMSISLSECIALRSGRHDNLDDMSNNEVCAARRQSSYIDPHRLDLHV